MKILNLIIIFISISIIFGCSKSSSDISSRYFSPKAKELEKSIHLKEKNTLSLLRESTQQMQVKEL